MIMSRLQCDLIMIPLTCVQPMVVSGSFSTHMLLMQPLEPLRRQEGHPQRTLLVPTKDPSFLGDHGHDIQEFILGSCHSTDHQHSLRVYNMLRRC